MLRRGKWLAVVAVAVAAVGAVPAHAASAGTETFTEHEHEVVFLEAATTNPCDGEFGKLLAVAKNSKIHVTQQADGDAWVTGTANGTVTFTPFEQGSAIYSGHFTTWFGESLNNKNSVEHFTSTFQLKGSDGSTVTVKMRSHLSTNAKGEVKVESHVESARCG